jgi:hypothetical protein
MIGLRDAFMREGHRGRNGSKYMSEARSAPGWLELTTAQIPNSAIP